ncbi:hypothetical protein PHMEG_0003574 [Phytophthora megakarya]|uniref:Uncharacterized protein n=1 Tax=Phytophthora megakarya TaxID=4795 RepID=A0A225WW52_9STRA|nr:hypothetical protein PHMEG_0003574 [Phytophthora megakarya]
MSVEVERRSGQPSKTKAQVSGVSTDVQRKERNAMQPKNIVSALEVISQAEGSPPSAVNGEENEPIDEYMHIARMEAFEQMIRFGYVTSKSNSKRHQQYYHAK